MKLLEKIEELTLYTMQQSKAIDKKDREITTLKSSLQATIERKNAEIAHLNSQLTALEQMMERIGTRER